MPDLHADAIARAAALGHIDRQDEASTVVAELLELEPDFKESGLEIIQRIFPTIQEDRILQESNTFSFNKTGKACRWIQGYKIQGVSLAPLRAVRPVHKTSRSYKKNSNN